MGKRYPIVNANESEKIRGFLVREGLFEDSILFVARPLPIVSSLVTWLFGDSILFVARPLPIVSSLVTWVGIGKSMALCSGSRLRCRTLAGEKGAKEIWQRVRSR